MFSGKNFRVTYLGICLALMTLIVVGCRQSTYVSQENPLAPLYHAQGVDFNSYDTAVIKLTTRFTSDGELYQAGEVDEKNSNTMYSLDKWLRQSGYFKNIMDNTDDVSGNAVIINAEVTVDWSSTTKEDTETEVKNMKPIRIKKKTDGVLLGRRYGKVAIAYHVFDKDTNRLIAKMTISDAKIAGMGSEVWDSGQANLAYKKIEKWNSIFVDSVLGLRAAQAEVSVRPNL